MLATLRHYQVELWMDYLHKGTGQGHKPFNRCMTNKRHLFLHIRFRPCGSVSDWRSSRQINVLAYFFLKEDENRGRKKTDFLVTVKEEKSCIGFCPEMNRHFCPHSSIVSFVDTRGPAEASAGRRHDNVDDHLKAEKFLHWSSQSGAHNTNSAFQNRHTLQ